MFHNPQITLHANFEKGKRGTRVSLFGKRAAIKSGLKNEQRPFEKIKKKKKKGISIRFESEEKGTLIWPWRESVTNGAYRLLAPITLHRGEGGGGVACSTGN